MLKQIFVYLVTFIFSISLVQAQLGGVHNYSDSNYIPKRKMNQQGEFINNKAGFPAKPRDQWQFGIFAGFPYIDGDCPIAFHGAGVGPEAYSYGLGAHIRKAIGYVISIRSSLAYYNMVGLDYQPNGNLNNSQTIINYYSSAPKGYVHNYRTMAFVPSLEALISFNNIMFHAKQQRWNLYGLIGYTGLVYQTRMNLINSADGGRYLFENITQNYSRGWTRQQLRAALRDMMDNNYETVADVNDRRPGISKNWHLRHCFSSGLGIEYRMGKKWSMNFEYKRIQTRDDYVDGWYRQSGDLRYPVFTSEFDNIAFGQIGANFNIGNSKKSVPPLWWLNPLEFTYADLATSRAAIAKMFKVKDEDGDGVIDELDQEPNTPEGCPVDTHGVTADTDGDGVPDCKDKEKLTQQKCFPVDADGVGNCPEPNCCDSMQKRIGDIEKKLKDIDSDTSAAGKKRRKLLNGEEPCSIGDLPSIAFATNSYKLSKDAEAVLAIIADKMKNNQECNIKVIGYGNSDKSKQQLSWDRVNAVIKYLVEQQNVPETRFIFEYGQIDGDELSVDLIGTKQTGPNSVKAPHPEYRGKVKSRASAGSNDNPTKSKSRGRQ